MFTALFKRFRRPEKEYQGETPYDTLIHQIGVLHELTSRTFIPSLTRRVIIHSSTQDVTQLSSTLIEATVFCHSRTYIPDHWSKVQWVNQPHSFADYITVDAELIHPIDWIDLHRHYIEKLAKAFLSMDRADREYYQRKCGFLIDDLLALIASSKQCLDK